MAKTNRKVLGLQMKDINASKVRRCVDSFGFFFIRVDFIRSCFCDNAVIFTKKQRGKRACVCWFQVFCVSLLTLSYLGSCIINRMPRRNDNQRNGYRMERLCARMCAWKRENTYSHTIVLNGPCSKYFDSVESVAFTSIHVKHKFCVSSSFLRISFSR